MTLTEKKTDSRIDSAKTKTIQRRVRTFDDFPTISAELKRLLDHQTPRKMAEAREINLDTNKSYKANSLPCRIRFTGEHPTVSKHLIKIEENDETITYLRGRKLHGKSLGLQGHVIAKDDLSDEVKSIGRVESLSYFEREGVAVEKVDRIKEFIDLTNIIHADD